MFVQHHSFSPVVGKLFLYKFATGMIEICAQLISLNESHHMPPNDIPPPLRSIFIFLANELPFFFILQNMLIFDQFPYA